MGNPRSSAYAELWGIVDGAVTDAFKCHPDYLTSKGQSSARTSIVKRVTGTVLSFAAQAAQGRVRPAETPMAIPSPAAGEVGDDASPSIHAVRIGKVTFKRRASSRILTEFNVTTNRLIAARKSLQQGWGN